MTTWNSQSLFLIPTVVITACFACILLNRVNRSRQASRGFIILAIHIMIVIFRSDNIFSYVNNLFPVNHVAWLILVFSIFIALYLTLKLMQDAGGSFPYKYVSYTDKGYILLLSIVFFFVSQTPANIKGVPAYTMSQCFFMLMYYSYTAYISIGLFWMSIGLRKKEKLDYQTHRWVAIGIGLICYASYNSLALINIFFIYLSGEKSQLITQTSSLILFITTFAAIPIFAPGWFYKFFDRIVVFLKKTYALHKLLKVKAYLKKENFCEFSTMEPDENFRDTFNINFHLHKSLMFIQDYKYHATHVFEIEHSEEMRKKYPITIATIQADDKKDGWNLIKAYNQCLDT